MLLQYIGMQWIVNQEFSTAGKSSWPLAQFSPFISTVCLAPSAVGRLWPAFCGPFVLDRMKAEKSSLGWVCVCVCACVGVWVGGPYCWCVGVIVYVGVIVFCVGVFVSLLLGGCGCG